MGSTITYERDDETGLDFAQARYYGSLAGRFISPDEFSSSIQEISNFASFSSHNPTFYADISQPQTFNKYQYSLNNPLRYTDPKGHQQEDSFLEQAKQYLLQVFNSTVNWNWSKDEENKEKVPDVLSLPSGKDIVNKHFNAIVTTSEVLSDVIELVDPIGSSSVIRNTITQDQAGVVIALAGMAEGGKKTSVTLSEAKKLVGSWIADPITGKAKDSIAYHFSKHGAEVGAENVWQYLRKATEFSKNLRGISPNPVSGSTDNVERFRKNGKYIDIQKGTNKIVSFGK